MYAFYVGPLTKKTATLEIPANVDGDNGLPPWCRAKTTPEKAQQLDRKTERVCAFLFVCLCVSQSVSTLVSSTAFAFR